MKELTRRRLALVAALSVLTACQSADRGPVGSTSVSQDHGGDGSARTAVDPAPVPGQPGPVPVPGRGGSGVPGKPGPVPVPGAPNTGPAPGAPAKPTPEPSATPGPGDPSTPTPTPTPTPPPTINVTISGPNAGDFQAFRVTADGDVLRHVDETWFYGARNGDIVIQTTNAKRNDPTDPQAVLTITADQDVSAYLHHDAPESASWVEAEGFEHIGAGEQLDTPTSEDPDSVEVYSIREKMIGRSGQATLGPNYDTPATGACALERNCRPMYFLVIRKTGVSPW
jgi:hypothetical protein